MAHEGPETPAVTPAITPQEQHRPTLLPDRVMLTWTGNPAHTQDVTWRTSLDVQQAYIEYAVATGGPDFTENRVRVSANSQQFSSDLGTYLIHGGRMAALAPATRYAYRVGDGVNWSEWFQFRTASSVNEPFSFIYFGDAQNDIRSMWSRVIREAHADAPRAAFFLHAGDLVNSAENDSEWGEWFGGGSFLNAMIPSIATPGNHEYAQSTNPEGAEIRTLSKFWRPLFAFPENGPDGLKESVYYLDYQGARIISLNSNEQLEKQVDWLRKVLAGNTQRWTIVTFHHPVYSSAKGRDNEQVRKLWKPVLDEFRVDLVLQGHDHSYARTDLNVPDNLSSGVNVKEGPTVYVVSVSGPKQYPVEDREFFARAASGLQLYQVIHVSEDELRYDARLAQGELYDSFVLRKRAGEFNELINQVPDTSEARRYIIP